MSIFTNKIVWITGASSGIGEALVYAFAREGAKIVLSARRKEELERVRKEAKLTEENSFIIPLDLSNTIAVDDLTKQVIAKFNRIDILINNGGISQRATAAETSIEIDRQIMEVNFFGQIALTKSVLPYMLSQKSGQVVVMSSIAGKFGFYLRSAYSASKHALQGFFESFRLETESQGIRTLIVAPGKIKTSISLNAVKGDGSSHNSMDKATEDGMPADECAQIILNAIRDNKEEILIGGKEIKAVWLKRIFPGWFGKVIRKQKRE
jgi:dehydrogenase/reductase SDR family member 7B